MKHWSEEQRQINFPLNERNGTENPSRNCRENLRKIAMCKIKLVRGH